MAKVFIVTSGVYSDYGIERVFSTRELAEQYVDTQDDSYSISEWSVDETIEKENKLYLVEFTIPEKMLIQCSLCYQRSYADCIEYDDGSGYVQKQPRLYFYVESDSRERAVKIASERFGAVIANEQIVFPHLREKIISGGQFLIWKEGRYPRYNFHNGNIVFLEGMEEELKLSNQKDIKVEMRKYNYRMYE